jgi:hypothetical protein
LKVAGRVVGYWNEPVSVEIAVNRQSAMAGVIGQRAALISVKINSPVEGSLSEIQLRSA